MHLADLEKCLFKSFYITNVSESLCRINDAVIFRPARLLDDIESTGEGERPFIFGLFSFQTAKAKRRGQYIIPDRNSQQWAESVLRGHFCL